MDPFELVINTSLTTRDDLRTVKLFENILDEHHVEVDRHTCIMSPMMTFQDKNSLLQSTRSGLNVLANMRMISLRMSALPMPPPNQRPRRTPTTPYFESLPQMNCHQYMFHKAEVSTEVRSLNSGSRESLLMMTMSLSLRTSEHSQLSHPKEHGEISVSVAAMWQEEDLTRSLGTTTPGLKYLSTLS